MAGWNGSGVFVRLYNWVQDQANGIKILASRMDGEFNNYKTGLENCVTRDGQNVPLDDLPMGGFKHTGVANASATDEYMALGQFTTQLNTHSQDFTNTVSINGTGLAAHKYFAINVDASKDAAMYAQIASVLRWTWGCIQGAAWKVLRYDGSGVYIDSPISIDLSTGKVSINGDIIQRGTATVAGGGGVATINFPITFANTSYTLVYAAVHSVTPGNFADFMRIYSTTTTSAQVICDYLNGGGGKTACNNGTVIEWLAIGQPA